MKIARAGGCVTLIAASALLVGTAVRYWRDPYDSYFAPLALGVIAIVVGAFLVIRGKPDDSR